MTVSEKTLIAVYTYNESSSLPGVIEDIDRVFSGAAADILIVDGGSDDGTLDAVKQDTDDRRKVMTLVQDKERGRGRATLAAFERFLSDDYAVLVEMDGDGSHRASDIPGLLSCISETDIVFGSRFMPGGSDTARSIFRRILTRMARLALRANWRPGLSDPTSGFKAYSRQAVEKILGLGLAKKDPGINLEILYHAMRGKMRFAESPVRFRKRAGGRSKLRAVHLFNCLLFVLFNRPGAGQTEKG